MSHNDVNYLLNRPADQAGVYQSCGCHIFTFKFLEKSEPVFKGTVWIRVKLRDLEIRMQVSLAQNYPSESVCVCVCVL